MKQIIMLGAGGFAREVLGTIDAINVSRGTGILPIGFVYDGASKDSGKLIHDLPVLGEISCIKEFDLNNVQLVAAVGRSVWRHKMVEKAKKLGANFISIIHPTAIISKWAKIGEGSIIRGFSTVMPGVVIGNYFVGNSFVSIGHDAIIGDFVHMNPHVFISGNTVVGDDVYIGVRATVLPCKIGDGAVIGACALVTKDVPPNMLAKGIPAKFYEMKEKEY